MIDNEEDDDDHGEVQLGFKIVCSSFLVFDSYVFESYGVWSGIAFPEVVFGPCKLITDHFDNLIKFYSS